MSLYQCDVCGAMENTALAGPVIKHMPDLFNWVGIEDRKGRDLCSVCAPTTHSDGTKTGYGKWHGRFERIMLPKGQFKTNNEGNLEHIESGSTDYMKFAIK